MDFWIENLKRLRDRFIKFQNTHDRVICHFIYWTSGTPKPSAPDKTCPSIMRMADRLATESLPAANQQVYIYYSKNSTTTLGEITDCITEAGVCVQNELPQELKLKLWNMLPPKYRIKKMRFPWINTLAGLILHNKNDFLDFVESQHLLTSDFIDSIVEESQEPIELPDSLIIKISNLAIVSRIAIENLLKIEVVDSSGKKEKKAPGRPPKYPPDYPEEVLRKWESKQWGSIKDFVEDNEDTFDFKKYIRATGNEDTAEKACNRIIATAKTRRDRNNNQ